MPVPSVEMTRMIWPGAWRTRPTSELPLLTRLPQPRQKTQKEKTENMINLQLGMPQHKTASKQILNGRTNVCSNPVQ